MAGHRMQFRNPAGHAGLLNNLLALANALADYFGSRAGLFARESKEALAHFILLAVCLFAAAVLCGIAYVFLLASVVVGVANALHVSWVWTALVAALIHFGLAIVFLLIGRSRIRKPVFRATAEELKKDRGWLKNLDKKNPSTS